MGSTTTNSFLEDEMQVYSSATAFSNNYTAKIRSRPQYLSMSKREAMAELFRFLAFCDFSDELGFDISFFADNKRFEIQCSYNQTDETEFDDAGIPHFRNVLEIVPQEGAFGTFFEYQLEKVIPSDGVFNWIGGSFKLISRPELGPEFTSGTGEIATGW